MNFLKKILGIAPQETKEGIFIPSKLALRLATSDTTDFEEIIPKNPYKGNKKILMICTEERNMTMQNGTKFSTGNHPIEMLLPLLHMKNAGFDVDIFTATGKSVKIEMWAMPEKDEKVKNIYEEYKNQFENPQKLSDFVSKNMLKNDKYLGIFIPGGHGAMLGLPENKDLEKLLSWAFKKDLFIFAICHGPAALLCLENQENFVFKGYKMAVFPDKVDEQSPMIGYMPGKLPWKFGEKLQNLGVELINKKADKTCFVDRKLITGASPKAANEFGKLCVKKLLKYI